MSSKIVPKDRWDAKVQFEILLKTMLNAGDVTPDKTAGQVFHFYRSHWGSLDLKNFRQHFKKIRDNHFGAPIEEDPPITMGESQKKTTSKSVDSVCKFCT